MTRSEISLLLRMAGYLALQVVVLAVYVLLVDRAAMNDLGDVTPVELLRENRWLEWCQIAVLVGIMGMTAGAFRRGGLELHQMLALVAAMALFRELDSFIEDYREDLHRVGIILAGGTAAVRGWFARRALIPQVGAFLRRPGWYLMMFGFALVTIYSQLLGQRELWDYFAIEDIANLAKRFVEEGIEFMGYVVIACGVFEERFFGSAPSSNTR